MSKLWQMYLILTDILCHCHELNLVTGLAVSQGNAGEGAWSAWASRDRASLAPTRSTADS